jgi:hypothetical protein
MYKNANAMCSDKYTETEWMREGNRKEESNQLINQILKCQEVRRCAISNGKNRWKDTDYMKYKLEINVIKM